MKNQTKPITADSLNPDSPERISVNQKPASFPVVGIGASAGGLEALELFFANMPADCGMAFVVIQHLDPTHTGIMRELLQRITEMHVYTATDRMRVKPSCVYIIPPNKSMSIFNGALYLFDPIETRGLRLPVDFFFRSLADDRLDKSIGVILSGMGSDGSLGLKAIKEKGGLILVQDPSTARFDSMPRSASEATIVDISAPANELPFKLINLLKMPVRSGAKQELEKDSSSLEKINILLRNQTGNDFSQYKKNTVYRRIERRMGIHQISKINSYVRFLQENSAEVEILFRELLIGVTSFFRDTAVWECLRDKALPSLFAKFPHGHVFRAWIAGCSTGEEAYSMAIVFKEALETLNNGKNFSLQIFATDLDSHAIEKARKGIYPANIVSDVSATRLNRFFIHSDDHYRVNAEIREMVVFAPQNVIKDPPFTKLDILSCRNLLIYLDAGLQQKLLSLFHYSLNYNGILVLGSAETQSGQNDFLKPVDSKLRIYQRSGFAKTDELLNFPTAFSQPIKGLSDNQLPVKVPDNLQILTDQLLLQQFSPSSVLVTDKGDILYITGSTGKYLEPAAGKANMNIFAMAREGLRNELPIAFRKAMQNYEKLLLPKIKVISNGIPQYANITIQQIEKPIALKGRILIVFADITVDEQSKPNVKRIKSPSVDLRAEIELELQQVKEELQSTREEMQTSQEELKSTNEELQSTNEELQSTNEELTTSKEEMQSLNEELQTVNIELQIKIDDFARINNDMNNLLNSIEVATLFLDKNLKIRQFTFPATKIFKLIPSDIGRVFTDQVSDLNYPALYEDASEVLRTLIFQEKEVSTRDGRWFIIRIMPYRTFEDRIDGLVITFIDITKAKKLETTLRKSELRLNAILSALHGIVIGLSPEGKIAEFNKEAEIQFGLSRNEVIGRKYVDVFIGELSRRQVETEMNELFLAEIPFKYSNILKTAKGRPLEIVWSVYKFSDTEGMLIGFIALPENEIIL